MMLAVDFDWVCDFIRERIEIHKENSNWPGDKDYPQYIIEDLLKDLKEKYQARLKDNEMTAWEEL